MSAHAADSIHRLLVDVEVLRIYRIAADEHADDLNENDLAYRPPWSVV